MGRVKALQSPGQFPQLHLSQPASRAPETADVSTLPAKGKAGLPPLASKAPVVDEYFHAPSGRNPRRPHGKATSASPTPAKLSYGGQSRSQPPRRLDPSAYVHLTDEALTAMNEQQVQAESAGQISWMERTQQSQAPTQRSSKFDTSFNGTTWLSDQERPKPSASTAEKVYGAPVVPGLPSNRLRSRRPRRQNGGMLPLLTRPILRQEPKEEVTAVVPHGLREKVLETLENALSAETLPVDVQTRVLQAVDRAFSFEDYSGTATGFKGVTSDIDAMREHLEPEVDEVETNDLQAKEEVHIDLQEPLEVQEPTLPRESQLPVSLVPRPPTAERSARRPGPRPSSGKVAEPLEVQAKVVTVAVIMAAAKMEELRWLSDLARMSTPSPAPASEVSVLSVTTLSDAAEAAAQEAIAGITASAETALQREEDDLLKLSASPGPAFETAASPLLSEAAAELSHVAADEIVTTVGQVDSQSQRERVELFDFAGEVTAAAVTFGLEDFLSENQVFEVAEVDFFED